MRVVLCNSPTRSPLTLGLPTLNFNNKQFCYCLLVCMYSAQCLRLSMAAACLCEGPINPGGMWSAAYRVVVMWWQCLKIHADV
jgi:hypothetical protein